MKMKSLRGLSESTLKAVLPGILYRSWPDTEFHYNCTNSPERVTIHARRGNYKIFKRRDNPIIGSFRTQFGSEAIAYAYGGEDRVIVVNAQKNYSVITQIVISDMDNNKTSDYCYSPFNQTSVAACIQCMKRLKYEGMTKCKLISVGFESVIAHEMGHLLGLRHTHQLTVMNANMKRRRSVHTQPDSVFNVPDSIIIHTKIMNK